VLNLCQLEVLEFGVLGRSYRKQESKNQVETYGKGNPKLTVPSPDCTSIHQVSPALEESAMALSPIQLFTEFRRFPAANDRFQTPLNPSSL